ncbi:tRNA epoxyqueuosine(34) reductase QueG [Puteibacter caeruleilacunae]|nr:tRNA epoxyqueuosine(34) reductase QueG [Puteibacter caeruleilacunae]
MQSTQQHNHSLKIKQAALKLGLQDCGIAKADFLEDEKSALVDWLQNDMHGEMRYMENHLEKRLDPRLLVDNARSVISVLLNYYPQDVQNEKDNYIISKYAYGKDYHFVLKEKLNLLLEYINEHIAPTTGRAFVDSAPVLDRAWAKRAGLGWIGRNSNLISRKHGSFFFIGELIIDLDLAYDHPLDKDYCGNCSRCIEACPTNAIIADKVIDARKCISYQTIEYRGELSSSLREQLNNRIFGCDICQDVCPWNLKSHPHDVEAFIPHPDLLRFTKSDWKAMDRNQFNEIFRRSAVKRTKYDGLRRNIDLFEE